jgi:NAD(P)-dependent dehydrogenase (short-subunit alcohol dehydrogenase family)
MSKTSENENSPCGATSESDDRYTLITGASSGIGRAIALHLSHTRRLILHGRDVERLNETRVRSFKPENHVIWRYDLREIDGLAQSLSSFVVDKGIAVECFIHSAGLLKILPIRSVNHHALTEVMDTNFVSAVEIISVLVKKKINRQRLKNILLISSIISNFGAPGFSMYGASKGALDSLMRSLAVELAPNIRVNSILPGGIHTEMTADLLAEPGVKEKFERGYPLGCGRLDDVVNAADFLVSDQTRWITGQQVVVDGGRTVNISI